MLSVIIPFKYNHCPYRLKNMRYVIDYYQNEIGFKTEIIVAEQDSNYFENYNNVVHAQFNNDFEDNQSLKDAIHLSRMRNEGVKKATFDNILIVDSDLIIEKESLLEGINVLDHKTMYYPIKRTPYELTEEQTKQFQIDGKIREEFQERFIDDPNYTCKGGALMIQKQTYERLGGHSEAFIGYGGEDDEFHKRFTHNGIKEIRGSLSTVHLYHPKSNHVKSWMNICNNCMFESNHILTEEWKNLQIQHYHCPKKTIGAVHYLVNKDNIDKFYSYDFASYNHNLYILKHFKEQL